MSIKKVSIRSVRKSAFIGTKVLHKGLSVTTRVEDKATRILNGTDQSFQLDETIPFEKIYYNSLPYITPLNPALPAVGSVPNVTLLIPTLDNGSFFGGTATALVVAAKIAIKTKRKLKIVQTLKTGKTNSLEPFFKREGVPFYDKDIDILSVADRQYNVYGYINYLPDDIFIASAWWDAYLLGQLPLTQKFIYLIQDFEPIFYNNSDLYILAESTYKTDKFLPLANTRLMNDFMSSRKYGAFSNKSDWFEPAVSRLSNGLVEKKKPGQKKRMFLYGRPNVHRNMFFTAINSIDYALKSNFIENNEWEYFMAGQDGIADIQLSSGPVIKNLGKMPMEKYLDFMKSVDLTLSLMMAPHPNYPTLEFASMGTAVVTTKYANKVDLKDYSKNIVTSEIDVESIAGAINSASKMPYGDRVQNAKNSTIPDSWNDSLDDAINSIIKKN